MIMTFEEFLADVKSDLYSYDSKGLINDISVASWVYSAIRSFGGTVTIYTEDIFHIRKGQVRLPEYFWDMYYAVRCDPDVCYCDNDEQTETPVFREIGYTVMEDEGFTWNSCNECCVDREKHVITEKVYITGVKVNKVYKNPRVLKLGKSFKPNACANDCINLRVKKASNEININGNTLYADFDGPIYMMYRAFPYNENGLPDIPESDLGGVQEYVIAYVKSKILENIFVNNEDAGAIVQKMQYYVGERTRLYRSALAETKMSRFTAEAYRRFAKSILKRMDVNELLMPEVDRGYRQVLIGF